MLSESTKEDETTALLLVEKEPVKFGNSVVRKNVTRDFRICLTHDLFIFGQITTKL